MRHEFNNSVARKKSQMANKNIFRRRTAFCILYFVVCHLQLASCTFSPPQAPSWDANINLPIINKRYSVQELIKNENDLYTDGNGLVHFVSESQLDSFNIGDRLAIGAFSRVDDTRLGVFKVPSPGSVNVQLTLQDLYPPAVNLAGQTVPLPGFSFALRPLALPQYDNYLTLEVASGNLSLSLRNDLPVPLGSPLSLEIRNGVQGAVIVKVEVSDPIQPAQEFRRTISLAGKSFGNNLALVVAGNSPGSGGAPVQNINPASKLALTLTLSDLQVNRANAKIGQQIISDAGETALGDSLNIEFADLRNGALSLSLKNNFLVGAWMVVTLPDFYTANNTAVTDSILLVAKNSSAKNIELAGYSFRPQPAAFGQQKIRFRWRIRTTNGPDEFVSFSSGDEIAATFASGKIVFAKFKGRFNAKTIALTPQRFKIDLPEGLDSLRLDEVSLQVRLRNGINFPMRADFVVEGIPNQGQPVKMIVRGEVKAGQADGTPVESLIPLNKANSNIVQFFNALPKSIIVRGKVSFGEPAYTGIIRDTDLVDGSLKFDAPLAFSLPAQKVESDIDVLNIDKSTRDRLKNKLQRGKMMMQFNNHLPVGAEISLRLAQKRANVFAAPDLSLGPFGILAPDIDPTTGRVIQAKANAVEISLDEKQLELFQKAPLYTGVLIHFPGTNGQFVRVVADDYVDIQAVAEINFVVSEGEGKSN